MKRLAYLDSVRGLAALIVVTTHLAFASEAFAFIDTTGIKLLRASGFAVVIFFVLSGFVLFQQIQKESPSYFAFVVRRVFRLFPPCMAAVTASYAIYLTWSPPPAPHLTEWFNSVTWPQGITFDQYVGHLLLTGDDALLRPIWSLVYEWRISLIFPLMVAVFAVSPRIFSAAVFGLAYVLARTSAWQANQFAWVLYTAFYGSFFLAGLAIARYQVQIAGFLGRWRYLRYAMFAAVFYWTDLRSQQSGLIGIVYVGIAAILFIAAAISDPDLQRWLQIPPLVFLGRISYSLYLWHVIVIGMLFRVLDGVPPLLIGALCTACSIAVATVMYRLTEAPCIRLGRELAAAWSRRSTPLPSLQ